MSTTSSNPEALDLGDLVRAARTGSERADLRLRLESHAATVVPLTVDTTVALLPEIAFFVRRYVVLSPLQLVAIALWVLHTHVIDAADVTPYLSISSPEKRCGKTSLLEDLELLVAHPWLTGRVTAAVLARKIDAEAPTLLLDEGDAAFKGEKEYAEALRGILNTGHKRGGKTSCCVGAGANIGYADFSTFCAKAIAGIGNRLPDTVIDRSIPIEMKRRAKNERVERARRRKVLAVAQPLRQRIERWERTVDKQALAALEPEIPEQLDDRAADGWEPLLAIADLAGGEWSSLARKAALELSTGQAREDDSYSVRLLEDIRNLFKRKNADKSKKVVDRLTTDALIRGLADDTDAPWAEWVRNDGTLERGAPRRLAGMLKRHGIRSRTVRFVDGSSAKGYKREWFEEAWRRYLPKDPSHPSQPPTQAGSDPSGTRHSDPDVTDPASATTPEQQADVTDVTDSPPEGGYDDF